MKYSIWFVVLTYYPDKKRIASLVQNLRSHVVVVDNTPDSEKKKYVSTDIVFTSENLGYTGGMNRGMRYCFRRGAEWVVLVNDDLSISPQSASQFAASLKKIHPGVAGPFRGSLDPVRWTSVYPVPSGTSFDYLSGSFMAIHKNVIKKVGYFWEPYFIYYEDVELCQRAKRVGFPLIYIPIDATHKDTTTIKRGSVDHEYYLARNHLLFVERNAPVKVKIHEFLRLLKTFYGHRRSGNTGAEQGVRDYMVRRFGRRDT